MVQGKVNKGGNIVSHFTNGKKLPKTAEVSEAIRQRVKRKETGEQERVAKLKEKK